MAVMRDEYARDVGPAGAIGGSILIFVALGVGLGILGAVSAYAFATPGTSGTTGATASDTDMAAGAFTVVVALLPFLAAPLVALLAGVWAGTASRSAASGLLGGAVGTLVGIFAMILLVAAGLYVGGARALPDIQNVNFTIPRSLGQQLRFFVTGAGLTYLLAHVVIGGLAGLLVGGLMPKWARAAPSREAVRETPTGEDVVEDRRPYYRA